MPEDKPMDKGPFLSTVSTGKIKMGISVAFSTTYPQKRPQVGKRRWQAKKTFKSGGFLFIHISVDKNVDNKGLNHVFY